MDGPKVRNQGQRARKALEFKVVHVTCVATASKLASNLIDRIRWAQAHALALAQGR